MSDEASFTLEMLEINNWPLQQSIEGSFDSHVLSLENHNTSTSVIICENSKSSVLVPGNSGNVYGSSIHPPLTSTHFSLAESGEICAICLNDFTSEWGDVYTIRTCKHQFHWECIHRWKKEQESCPLCRGPLVKELRVIWLLQKLRLTDFRRIFEFLPPENESPLSTIEKTTNFILAPLGIAWVVLIIPLLLVLEIVCISLSLLVFFLFFSAVACCDCLTNSYELFRKVDIFITVMIVALMFLPYAFILHILLMIGIALNFSFQVLKLEKRWQDAFLHIARRTIFESFYYLL